MTRSAQIILIEAVAHPYTGSASSRRPLRSLFPGLPPSSAASTPGGPIRDDYVSLPHEALHCDLPRSGGSSTLVGTAAIDAEIFGDVAIAFAVSTTVRERPVHPPEWPEQLRDIGSAYLRQEHQVDELAEDVAATFLRGEGTPSQLDLGGLLGRAHTDLRERLRTRKANRYPHRGRPPTTKPVHVRMVLTTPSDTAERRLEAALVDDEAMVTRASTPAGLEEDPVTVLKHTARTLAGRLWLTLTAESTAARLGAKVARQSDDALPSPAKDLLDSHLTWLLRECTAWPTRDPRIAAADEIVLGFDRAFGVTKRWESANWRMEQLITVSAALGSSQAAAAEDAAGP